MESNDRLQNPDFANLCRTPSQFACITSLMTSVLIEVIADRFLIP